MIMKEQKDVPAADPFEAEGQRAAILRAALLQLLAETEQQMTRIENAFEALDK